MIHNFTGGLGGTSPLTGLTMDASGNFYGTTYNGGAHGYGTHTLRAQVPSPARSGVRRPALTRPGPTNISWLLKNYINGMLS